MKHLFIALLILFSVNAEAQILIRDKSIGGLSYCNVLLTDSSNAFANLQLKIHIDILDKGDSVNGAIFIYTLYSLNGTKVSDGKIPVCGGNYIAWDANNEIWDYTFTALALATQNIFLTFEE